MSYVDDSKKLRIAKDKKMEYNIQEDSSTEEKIESSPPRRFSAGNIGNCSEEDLLIDRKNNNQIRRHSANDSISREYNFNISTGEFKYNPRDNLRDDSKYNIREDSKYNIRDDNINNDNINNDKINILEMIRKKAKICSAEKKSIRNLQNQDI